MKVDFSKTIVDLNGEVILRPQSEEDVAAGKPTRPLTAGSVAADSLLAPSDRQSGPFGVGQVLERFTLAQQVYGGGEHEITAAQATTIQEAVVKFFAPLVAAQVIQLTNGD